MMKTAILAAAVTLLALGAAAAQEDPGDGPITVMKEPNSLRIEGMLDAKDIELMRASRARVLEDYEDGQTLTWLNPASGHSGRVSARGNNAVTDTRCRTIDEQVLIGGVIYDAPDYYCRLAYGYWTNRKSYTRQFAGHLETPANRRD